VRRRGGDVKVVAVNERVHWRVISSHLRIAGNNSPVDSQIITLLKDYWLPIVMAFAALGLWVHHRITALLDDDEE
jgi:hypothetical protein